MSAQEIIPHLFRTEYRKIVSVLCKAFGAGKIAMAEDVASDTFLQAAESWVLRGVPEHPVPWLYAVARNKALNVLRREALFASKISSHLKANVSATITEPDMSADGIRDSQLQMMFAICHPSIPSDAQVCLSLRILCGFGIDEIAAAFLTNKETINKRLFRAREKLREEQVAIAYPGDRELPARLRMVLTTLYLLFSEGYYSASHQSTVRKELCAEAMRLAHLLTEYPGTDLPVVNALLALMSFQASRLDARVNTDGDIVLYDDQDEQLWDKALIAQGEYFLNKASDGPELTRYHIEAAIAYWHTGKEDTPEKWERILQLYNHLLLLEYSPMAALNRTYALAKARGKEAAIIEAEQLKLPGHQLYYALLGELYTGVDNMRAAGNWQQALALAQKEPDKKLIEEKLRQLCV